MSESIDISERETCRESVMLANKAFAADGRRASLFPASGRVPSAAETQALDVASERSRRRLTMSVDKRDPFRVSFLTGEPELRIASVSAILARVQSGPVWDTASITPINDTFPRLHIEWHGGYGFVIQCYEDEHSWSYFLVAGSSSGPPTVEINLGGQALERWPHELFVPEKLAHRAVEYFLDSGKQDPALHWVRIDAFPRETIWEGRKGREAWERTQRRTNRDV